MSDSIFGRTGGAQRQTGSRAQTGKSNLFRNIAIILAVFGLLCASDLGGDVAAIAMFSVIGIPIALAINLVPTAALATFSAYLIWRFTPLSGVTGIVAAFGVTAGLMLAIPPLHNIEVNAKVARLAATDAVPADERVPQVSRNVVVGLPGTDRRASRCDMTCMHLLVSRQAGAVIMTRFNEDALIPDFAAKGHRYVLEPQGECDLSFVVAQGPEFKERREGTIPGAYGKAVDDGMCITRSEAHLSDAEVAVTSRRWQKFPQPTTLSPISSGIQASRTGIYMPDGNGNWQAAWQKTAINYSLLRPVLAHSWRTQGYSLRSEWWRTRFRAEPHMNRGELLAAMGYEMPEKLR